jgi:hypothetical protein
MYRALLDALLSAGDTDVLLEPQLADLVFHPTLVGAATQRERWCHSVLIPPPTPPALPPPALLCVGCHLIRHRPRLGAAATALRCKADDILMDNLKLYA